MSKLQGDFNDEDKLPMAVLKYLPTPLRNLATEAIVISRRSQAAWRESLSDSLGGLNDDPGAEAAVRAGLRWVGVAQDNSASKDGGIARHFHLNTGWATSYPETTGYTIPTLLRHARSLQQPELEQRARRALDWLLSIQFENGAFQGSTIGVTPVLPVTFDTGQILIGLAAGAAEFGEPCLSAMAKTADWLTQVQSADGAWRVENPYVDTHKDEPRTFETHVAWGLLEAARVRSGTPWGEAGLKNIRWAMARQHANGWFPSCCLIHADKPLTHTLAYAMRGVLEGYLFSREPAMLESALLTARALMDCVQDDGFLPGMLDQHWRAAASWACLTGTAQTAICWWLLYRETKDESFRLAALKANRYVRRTLHLDGPAEMLGGVKGSFPVSGQYGPFQFLNWACKFMIDANALELELA